jgi:hypothetical protein
VVAAAAAIGAFVVFDFGRFFTLSALKAELAALADYRDAHPIALAAASSRSSSRARRWRCRST